MSKSDLFTGAPINAPTLSTGACVASVGSHTVIARKKGVHHIEFMLGVEGKERALGVTLFPESEEDVTTAQGYKAVNNLIWAEAQRVEVALGHYLFTGNSRIRVGRVDDLDEIEEWTERNTLKQKAYAANKRTTGRAATTAIPTPAPAAPTPAPVVDEDSSPF